MGGEWRDVALGDLFKVKHGFAFKGEFFTDQQQSEILVTPGNFAIGGGFQDEKRKYYRGPVPTDYVLQPGQIVVTMTDLSKQSDTLGFAARIPNDANVWLHNQRVGLLVFNPSAEADARFVEYLLRSHEYRAWVIGSATGTTVKHTSPSRIEAFRTLVPPPTEQRAIAHILGTLDDKIELNRRRNQTLEAMARALFKDWFVDFGPVRAKMEGREPYLPADLWQLFPDRLDDEGKPEGWAYLPFVELLEGTIGGDWGKEHVEADHDQAVCIIRGTDIPDLLSGFTGKVPTRFTTKKKLASRILQTGDIVVEVSGGSPTQPTGRSLQVSQSMLERFPHPVVCASFCRRFRPKNHELGLLAACHLTNLYRNGGTWEYQNQSTGISNFQTSHFLEAENVLLPSQGVLEAFVRFFAPILAKTTSNENIALTQLRDTLLPKLISGELRITDAEKFLERLV